MKISQTNANYGPVNSKPDWRNYAKTNHKTVAFQQPEISLEIVLEAETAAANGANKILTAIQKKYNSMTKVIHMYLC